LYAELRHWTRAIVVSSLHAFEHADRQQRSDDRAGLQSLKDKQLGHAVYTASTRSVDGHSLLLFIIAELFWPCISACDNAVADARLLLQALPIIDLEDATHFANQALLFESEQRLRYGSAAQSQND